MALSISSKLHQQMLVEAAQSPDREVCGLLVGVDGIERIIPAANVAIDPSTSFEIDPATLFAAIRAERSGKARLLGYYHSHPAGPPAPSARDHAQATADGRVWIIIGEQRLTAWRMTDSNEFRMIALHVCN
jgi:desampylase